MIFKVLKFEVLVRVMKSGELPVREAKLDAGKLFCEQFHLDYNGQTQRAEGPVV